MNYPEEIILELNNAYLGAVSSYHDSLAKMPTVTLLNKYAKEHFLHGFMRRYNLIFHCLERIFNIYPPSRTIILTKQENQDVTIFLQAFFFNVYGAVDNLAWIINFEKELGLNKKSVSLFNKEISKYFTNEFNAYLNDNNKGKGFKWWYSNYCKNFRDAIGHRIPVYLPPYAVDPNNFKKHIFPVFLHSYGENSPEMYLHGQLICDFLLITELLDNFLKELKTEKNTETKD